jgi:hypothetical protein
MNLEPLMHTASFQVEVLNMHIRSADKRPMEWLLNVSNGDFAHIMKETDTEQVHGRRVSQLVVNGWMALAKGELNEYYEYVQELIGY